VHGVPGIGRGGGWVVADRHVGTRGYKASKELLQKNGPPGLVSVFLDRYELFIAVKAEFRLIGPMSVRQPAVLKAKKSHRIIESTYCLQTQNRVNKCGAGCLGAVRWI
jgi:hypothetical protein